MLLPNDDANVDAKFGHAHSLCSLFGDYMKLHRYIIILHITYIYKCTVNPDLMTRETIHLFRSLLSEFASGSTSTSKFDTLPPTFGTCCIACLWQRICGKRSDEHSVTVLNLRPDTQACQNTVLTEQKVTRGQRGRQGTDECDDFVCKCGEFHVQYLNSSNEVCGVAARSCRMAAV